MYEERRLAMIGQVKLIFRAIETELRKVVSENLGCLGEERSGLFAPIQ
jgi:hypothetical protein